jgi:hypothetical protein
MLAVGLALLAVAVPSAHGCNIQGYSDAAVRMSEQGPTRNVAAVAKTGKLDLSRYEAHRVGDPWPGARGTALRSYPR